MRALGSLPPWLRQGLEAGLIAAFVGIVTLVGSTSGASGGLIALPAGPAGALLLAPAVLALGVITVGYPVAYAATRTDAIFGTIAAFLVGADLAAIVLSSQVSMPGLGREMALGVLAGVLALGPALVGLVAGQLLTPLGFGRRSGAVSNGCGGPLRAARARPGLTARLRLVPPPGRRGTTLSFPFGPASPRIRPFKAYFVAVDGPLAGSRCDPPPTWRTPVLRFCQARGRPTAQGRWGPRT